MSISGISSSLSHVPVQPTQAVPQRNDRDGDEVNGVDPANESAREGAKAASAPSNPFLGTRVNQLA